MQVKRLFQMALMVSALTMVGCAVNPVTGQRELGLVSGAQEISLGEENYGPMQQMEGGVYQIDEALTAYVSEVGQRVAAHADRDLPYEFVVLNNSVPNAWALPGGKMAINRGLLTEMDSEAELAAVLGHEVVHAAARHGAQRMERGLLLQGAAAAVGIAASDSDYAPLVVGSALVGAQLLNQRYSRHAELEADRYGTLYMHRAGYNPEAAVSLQETFVRLSEGRQQDWLSGLFASHPPSTERVRANRQLADELGRDGEWGRERYQRMIAGLKESKPAYEAYEEGRKALAEGNHAKALQQADKALGMLPREAMFQGLRGDALQAAGRKGDALRAYDRAIQLNPDYFYFPLRRGLMHREASRFDQAERDLKRSVEMLPTQVAYRGLGDIAKSRGQTEQAQRYYQMAGDGAQ